MLNNIHATKGSLAKNSTRKRRKLSNQNLKINFEKAQEE
jgi:hypothetical protein